MHIFSTYKKFIIIILSVLAGSFLILFSILYIFNNTSEPSASFSVTSVTPSNQTQVVSLYEPISITFSRSLSNSEQSHIQIVAQPGITGNYEWQTDNSLTFTPTAPLWMQNSYSLTVTYFSNPLYSWSFSTPENPEEVPVDDQIKNQAKADEEFGKWVSDIYTNYPWYDKLPLMTDNYFVYFDLDQKKFEGKIYIQDISTPTPEQIQQYKDETITTLESLGVNTLEFQIHWTTEQKR